MRTEIREVTPEPAQYNALRRAVEWPTYDESLIKLAFEKTLFSVVAFYNNEPIGMGRVIGDGAIYLHVQDVIVKPEFQSKGIGKQIMEQLLSFINRHGGTNTNVGLMSSKGREPFYKSFGFLERPSEKFGAGMIMIKK